MSEHPDSGLTAALFGKRRGAADDREPGIQVWMADGSLLVVPIPTVLGGATLTADLRAVYRSSWVHTSNRCTGCRLVVAQGNVEEQAADNATRAAQVLELEQLREERAVAERDRLMAAHAVHVHRALEAHPDWRPPEVVLAERSTILDRHRSAEVVLAQGKELVRRLDASSSADFVDDLYRGTGRIAVVVAAGLLIAALDRPYRAPRITMFGFWLLLAIAGLLSADWLVDRRIARRLAATESPIVADADADGGRPLGTWAVLGLLSLLAVRSLGGRFGLVVAAIMVATVASVAVAPAAVHLVRHQRALHDAVGKKRLERDAASSELASIRQQVERFVCGEPGCPACVELAEPGRAPGST